MDDPRGDGSKGLRPGSSGYLHTWLEGASALAGFVWGECSDEGDAPTSIPQRPNSDRKRSTKAGKDIKCTGLAEAWMWGIAVRVQRRG